MGAAVRDPGAEAQLGDASTLCVSCGLCCTGTLYTHVPSDAGETERMRALGMTVGHVGDRPHFTLPCPHNQDGRCGIYADRFGKCRSFRCELLKRLDSGAVSLAEAQGRVAEARAQVARVAALSPAATQAAVRRDLRAAGSPTAEEAQLWVNALALDTFLDTHFRKHSAIAWSQDDSGSPRDHPTP